MTKKNDATRILIVDDHPAVREGLALRLEKQPGLRVCGCTGDPAEALWLLKTEQPDLAIVDLTLKNSHGLELIKDIKARHPAIGILVWSMHSESLYAERALRAGALGYVNKEEPTAKVIAAIHRVREGKYFLSEALAERMVPAALSPQRPGSASPLGALSDREMETFEFLGQGMNTTQIAERMRLSPKTVETYRARIKDKLHLTSGNELMRRAMQWALDRE